MTRLRPHFDLFASFFRIGLFTIGSGYAMLPLIEREVVSRRGWMETDAFLDALAVAQSLPGPVALNTAALVGHRMKGTSGAAAAVLGTALPSFGVMLLVAAFFAGVKDDRMAAALFAGFRPAAAALIAASVWRLARKAWRGRRQTAVALAAALVVWLGGVSPAIVVAVVALAGAALPGRQPAKEEPPDA